MLPVDINNPATWKFLAGNGSPHYTPEDSAQHEATLGANGAYTAFMGDMWGNALPVLENGLTQSQQLLRHALEFKRLGGIIHLQNLPWSFGNYWCDGHPEWGDQQTCELNGANWIGGFAWHQHAVINNIVYDGTNKQDEYIQWTKNTLQVAVDSNGSLVSNGLPDVLQIMNEVTGDNADGTATDVFWNNYVAFCNRYMAEMALIKPNLIFSISGIPFWNLTKIATKIFTIPAGCKLFYDYHYYYSFDGVRPDVAHIKYDIPEQLAYWGDPANGVPPDFALGKQMTWDIWLNGQGWDGGQGGIKTLQDQGKVVVFDEIGTHIDNPNFGVWMKDAVDFCVQYGLATSFLDNTGLCTDPNNSDVRIIVGPWDSQACYNLGGVWQFNFSPGSFWSNKTWTLNAIGQKWLELMGSATQITLPYQNSLNTLTNWQTINGTWTTV